MDSVYSKVFCSFVSDFISIYYYDCVYIIILVYSYRTNKEYFRFHRLLVFKDQGIISGQRHAEISSWFGELKSTFYKHSN